MATRSEVDVGRPQLEGKESMVEQADLDIPVNDRLRPSDPRDAGSGDNVAGDGVG